MIWHLLPTAPTRTQLHWQPGAWDRRTFYPWQWCGVTAQSSEYLQTFGSRSFLDHFDPVVIITSATAWFGGGNGLTGICLFVCFLLLTLLCIVLYCVVLPEWRINFVTGASYASLTSARNVGSELPPWLLAAPCQTRTDRCKHFESRWSVASRGYPAVAQPIHSFYDMTKQRQSAGFDNGGKLKVFVSRITKTLLAGFH